ncbi:hypothetical protein Tco_0760499 [Tanacetum coccineum]
MLCTPVHKIPDRRGRYYCLARRVHDKVKGLMLSPEMQVIADKLIEAHTELINSSEVEDGVDPLIMVVGPEYGGRTRGTPVGLWPRLPMFAGLNIISLGPAICPMNNTDTYLSINTVYDSKVF